MLFLPLLLLFCLLLYFSSVGAAAAVLLILAVRHLVPDVAKFVAGSLNLIPVFSSSSFKPDLFLIHPLAVCCRIYRLDLPTSSVITGMRGAKAGISLPRRSPHYFYKCK